MLSPNTKLIQYRADVDGLRAVAVLPVLFFHANLGFTGGYVGVDIFFVISGFLITGLILRDLNAGKFDIVRFWERRIRRIMPALAVVVLCSLIAGWFLLLPQGFKELGESASAQVLLSSNIYFWVKSWIGAGYFAPAAEVKPLLHTWSLAVEEQFYLFFPFLLVALWRFTRHSIVPAILFLAASSFLLSVWCSYSYPSLNFYILPTRAWELLMGAYLAAIPVQRHSVPRGVAEISSWAGLLAILCAVFCYNSETRFPGLTALLPCLGASLIIWANGHASTSLGKLLALRPVVFIGLISYSLYLWHWPILVFFKYWAIDPISTSQRLLLLLMSLVLAVLSWKFVETPFRQRVILNTRSQIFAFALSTTAILLLAGLAIFKLHGIPDRIPQNALQYIKDDNKVIWNHDLTLKEVSAGKFVELGCGNTKQSVDIFVWGDSHAMAVMPVLHDLCNSTSVRALAATHSATPPLVGFIGAKSDLLTDSVPFNNAIVAFIQNNQVPNVLLVANWGAYMTDTPETCRLRRGLLDTLNALKETHTKIWLLRQVPKQPYDVPQALASAVWHGRDIKTLGLPLPEHYAAFQHQNPIFEGLATQFPNVGILNPTPLLLDDSNQICRVITDGTALYIDDNHLSTAGAMLLRPLFEPIFAYAKQ